MIAREGRQEDHLLQLSEVGSHDCGWSGDQKQTINPKKPDKKKALKATWDPKSEIDEEVDTAHSWLMITHLR